MLAGASVFILDDEVRMDLVALNGFIERNGVTVAFMTTQIGTQIATMFQNKSLRVLSTGGEKMPPVNPPAYRLVNPYGPTECSLFSTQTLKAIPYSMIGLEVEFSPIDEVARAICLLSKTNNECMIFHPSNSHRVLMADVIDCMNRIGCNIEAVEDDTFREIVDNAAGDKNKVDILQSLLAYQSGEAAGVYKANNVYGSGYTTQVLFRLGFYLNTTTWDYMLKFLQAIGSLGVFDEDYTR